MQQKIFVAAFFIYENNPYLYSIQIKKKKKIWLYNKDWKVMRGKMRMIEAKV